MMNEIFGKRLQSARMQAGLSLDKLVVLIDRAVTKTALARYEKGVMMPKSEIIELLAEKLGLDVDYFFRPLTVSITGVKFRTNYSLGVRREESLKQIITAHIERYLELEQLLNISTTFENPLKGMIIRNREDVEKAANILHEKWNLGHRHLPAVMKLLENYGIKVIEIDSDDDFEGYSAHANGGIPIIVVRKSATTERKRLTALHELAHILLEFDPELTDSQIEMLCFNFGGAVLIPDQTYFRDFGTYRISFSKRELGIMKDTYGMSAVAFAKRTSELGVMSKNRLTPLFEMVRKDPMEKHIGTNVMIDNATRFDKMLSRAISERNISLTKAAELAGINIDELIKNYTDND
jgi:Zn-dependent peptidase ImmA (M78 family)